MEPTYKRPTNDLHNLHFGRLEDHARRFSDTGRLVDWSQRYAAAETNAQRLATIGLVTNLGLELWHEKERLSGELEHGYCWLERNAGSNADARYAERETQWFGLLTRYEAISAALELAKPAR